MAILVNMHIVSISMLSDDLISCSESNKDTEACQCGRPNVGSSAIRDKSTRLFAL
jgi:hypothetical protein